MFILKLRAAAASVVAQSALPMTARPPVVQVVPNAALDRWPHQLKYGAGSQFRDVETAFTLEPAAV